MIVMQLNECLPMKAWMTKFNTFRANVIQDIDFRIVHKLSKVRVGCMYMHAYIFTVCVISSLYFISTFLLCSVLNRRAMLAMRRFIVSIVYNALAAVENQP